MRILKNANLTIVGIVALFVVGLLLAVSSEAKVDPETIAAMWLFDEGRDDTAADSSANENEGNIVGAEWVDGRSGQALSFDGDDDYVEVQHSDSLQPESISGMAWVNLSNNGLRHIIFAKWSGYTLEVSSGGNPYFQIFNGQQIGATSPVGILWGEWHHLAGTFDASDNSITIYVDGEPTLTTKLGAGISYGQNVLRISNTLYNAGAVNGIVDEVAIFNVALEEEDIQDIMDNGLEKALGMVAVNSAGKLAAAWGSIKAQN